jgi:uncharacterized protein YndB with AHSA1/START domain
MVASNEDPRPDRIEREIVIRAAPQTVWRVVTEPQHLAGWFSDEAEVVAMPGREGLLVWHGHESARLLVEQVEPPCLFSFRWVRRSDEEPTHGNSTLVELHLSPCADGTLLRVVESGFRALQWPAADVAAYRAENSAGWASELEELRAYVEGLAA